MFSIARLLGGPSLVYIHTKELNRQYSEMHLMFSTMSPKCVTERDRQTEADERSVVATKLTSIKSSQ